MLTLESPFWLNEMRGGLGAEDGRENCVASGSGALVRFSDNAFSSGGISTAAAAIDIAIFSLAVSGPRFGASGRNAG